MGEQERENLGLGAGSRPQMGPQRRGRQIPRGSSRISPPNIGKLQQDVECTKRKADMLEPQQPLPRGQGTSRQLGATGLYLVPGCMLEPQAQHVQPGPPKTSSLGASPGGQTLSAPVRSQGTG
ncbi:unnamed protein product [Sphagnum balticum]